MKKDGENMNTFKRKTQKVLVFAVLLIGILTSIGWSVDSRYKDVYGKVIGQIMDPETGQPVNEKFRIQFLFLNQKTNKYETFWPIDIYKGDLWANDIITNEYGAFYAAFVYGNYQMRIEPYSENSKYSAKGNNYHTFNVNKGQITKISVVAKLGGYLHASLYDWNGNKIDPKKTFDMNAKIYVVLTNSTNNTFDNTFTGLFLGSELNISRIIPGEYDATIEFEFLGFAPIKKGKVFIKAKETTNLVVELNMNDKTGVEGFITDSSGNPIEKANVNLFNEIKEKQKDYFIFRTQTNEKGYYRLIGMPEGLFKIFVSVRNHNYSGTLSYSSLIELKKGVTIRKDIQFTESLKRVKK